MRKIDAASWERALDSTRPVEVDAMMAINPAAFRAAESAMRGVRDIVPSASLADGATLICLGMTLALQAAEISDAEGGAAGPMGDSGTAGELCGHAGQLGEWTAEPALLRAVRRCLACAQVVSWVGVDTLRLTVSGAEEGPVRSWAERLVREIEG